MTASLQPKEQPIKPKPMKPTAARTATVDPLMIPAEVGAILKLSETAVIKRIARGLIVTAREPKPLCPITSQFSAQIQGLTRF